MWLTRLALKNPVFILMLSLMLLVLGLVSLNRLSVDLFPDITIPVIRIATSYTGAGPADIEKSITQPIERAVSASPGVDRVESSSKQGVSLVSVWFNYGTNLDNAQFEVSQRIAQILNTLPPGIQQPFVLKFDITNIPILAVTVSSDSLDEKQLYDLAYNTIEPQLERIQGVASASVGGGKVREIEVMANASAMRARGIGILDLANSVRTSNLLLPSGSLRAGDRDYNVFTNTQVPDVGPLRHVIVRSTAASPGQAQGVVRISDVAEVENLTADQTEIVRINGQRGVYLRVLKQPGANTIAAVDAIRAAIPKLRGVPNNVKINISFDHLQPPDGFSATLGGQTLEQKKAFEGLIFAAIMALLLVYMVLASQFKSLIDPLVIMFSVPLGVSGVLIMLFLTGTKLSVNSFMGIIMMVGIVVSNGVLLVDFANVLRRRGKELREATIEAGRTRLRPILMTTIATVLGLIPMALGIGEGSETNLPLARAVIGGLMVSTFFTLFLVPALYTLLDRFAKRQVPDEDEVAEEIVHA
jgi:multidrug efflux pump subunit AcrB